MKKATMRAMLAASTAMMVLYAAPAAATNGYFAAGYSTQSKGMAGSGLTTAEGAMGLAQNPALGVSIGNSVEADITIFMPFRSATFDNAFIAKSGTYESDQNAFPMMSLGANYMLGENTSVGLVMYGNGGMNTNYQGLSLMGGTSPVGVDLAQAFLALNLAHRFSAANLTIGVAPVLAMQYFEAYGLTSFSALSSSPSNVSDYGYDISFGGGVRAGVLWDALPWLSVGATYQSKMWMSKFDDYKGLFADGGSFDIPASVQAGINLKPMKDLEILLEWQRIFYGDVSSIANTGTFTNYSQMLGLENGLGFGWKDMDVFRIGVQWHASPELTLRAGYSHASDFTDSSQVMFNTVAPATITDHISIGLTYNFTPGWQVTAAYTYAFENDLSGAIAASYGGGTETIRMDQHELSVGVTYKF